MRMKWLLLAPLAILGIFVFILIGGEVVMHLWNWLLPTIFGWREITFWQAIGMLALCRILFGRLGGHGGYSSRIRRRVAERMEKMTPEERERFRQGMRGRCGFGPSPGESKGP
jgi:hypothetical protein